ncbi:hypothetical protein CFOL_v3_23404, partial [Cephalotus follicularis]
MAAKNIIAYLNKSEKFDFENYDIWRRRIQYLLDEQEVLETLRQFMVEPEKRCKKDCCARFTMLSSMNNDLIGEVEEYHTASEMWNALK